MSNVIPRRPGMRFEQPERAIGMPTTGMSEETLLSISNATNQQ